MQATERKHKHKASDKTCFKHISNQKSWMQTSWFWWLKRILLFSDLSWSNWKEFSVSILVNPSHFWSIMFQTHTSGQSFTLLVNPSHFWSITSGRFFPCHACNFWSILHTSNQSVTLLPVTSGQSLTLPEGQFCTGQSGSRCNQRARQCIGAAKGRTASIWSPQCMKGSSPALKKGEQILPWSIKRSRSTVTAWS